jgi:hypothetical protein
MGEKLPRTGILKKDPFQNHFVPSTLRDIAAEEITHAVLKRATLPKGIFMNIARTERVAAPIPRKQRFLSNEKTGNRQSGDCHTCTTNNRYLRRYHYHGEKKWLSKIVITTEAQERCIRPSVPTVKKSAKSLSNPGKIVPCIAGIVFPSTKIAAAKKRHFRNPVLLSRPYRVLSSSHRIQD